MLFIARVHHPTLHSDRTRQSWKHLPARGGPPHSLTRVQTVRPGVRQFLDASSKKKIGMVGRDPPLYRPSISHPLVWETGFPCGSRSVCLQIDFPSDIQSSLVEEEGVIESDLWAAVKLGQLFPPMLEAVREGWDQRDRENKIFDCSPLPNADLIFPLIRILVYEILLATVLH